ncbi:hypothetical protein LOH54_02905 [Sulfurimonas sp. HSL-3221]|uniref:hypothetical protein n=1 Tax=Sulfurimonadaceae TaxID=2771471 RepID=UPI001E3F48DD|nr:hypothetical protein [Sulfurimonas sp. HSL-3221]UFS63083.1 hypothetical protein LOH54_02905 [Sulfurimonas sp. HSL-3221]
MTLNKSIEYISRSGSSDKPNEDGFDTNDAYYLLLDGATGLGMNHIPHAESDAKWFVQMFIKLFKEKYARGLTTKILIENVLSEIQKLYMGIVGTFTLPKYELPSASMVLIRNLDNGQVEVSRLGDCKAYYSTKGDEYSIFNEPKICALDNLILTKMKIAPISDDEIKSLLKKHRSLINTEDGYGALTIDSEGIKKCSNFIDKTVLNPQQNDRILLSTDGFSAVVDTYGYFSIGDLFGHSLVDIVEAIRKIEEDDSMLQKFPRFKKSDDASAIRLNY